MKYLALIHAVVIVTVVGLHIEGSRRFHIVDTSGLSDLLIASMSAIVLIAILTMRRD